MRRRRRRASSRSAPRPRTPRPICRPHSPRASERLANTQLVAASAVQAGNEFFNTDASHPPLRVDGPPFDTATGLVDGTRQHRGLVHRRQRHRRSALDGAGPWRPVAGRGLWRAGQRAGPPHLGAEPRGVRGDPVLRCRSQRRSAVLGAEAAHRRGSQRRAQPADQPPIFRASLPAPRLRSTMPRSATTRPTRRCRICCRASRARRPNRSRRRSCRCRQASRPRCRPPRCCCKTSILQVSSERAVALECKKPRGMPRGFCFGGSPRAIRRVRAGLPRSRD